ncbi:hypothetical protein CAOG_03840 [Capsaspora owczarzaki ATCC 30864]|uniref:Uncharacterized protein n=1 Tax=Capsaspora owczarzaki (strain ATCC 30864) TaxID=595528 RepID=A0A0D2VQL3_CAPO3|nr:hypothetical protein CAOG_03840 [Capsaspora owczarzaki ATCC 30864]KJE92972.1 hypothetical protein CAOG_003840 [Capsaspora owczarzaki ATCC 30864]|eukprot:XP_004363568.1 hypothetical protein CAOG_03840 [Capsaspora owczarzaki ATCC 30864]
MPSQGQLLHKAFEQANLPLTITATAREFAWGARDSTSFLMDIRNTKGLGKNEFKQKFVAYLGDGTDLQVTNVDPALHQLVLTVQEPVREIVTVRREWMMMERRYIEHTDRQWTTGNLHCHLVGVDEGHLFFCELPNVVSTVHQAHQLLRPKQLVNKPKTAFKRQGEWFLVPVPVSECAKIQEAATPVAPAPFEPWGRAVPNVQTHYRNTALGVHIGRGPGRGHVADEIVVYGGREFARGKLQHPDHVPRHLKDWHEVLRNQEKTSNVLKHTNWMD